MTDRAVAALRAILEETPPPPSPDADAFDVISAVEKMTAQRHAVVEELRVLLGEDLLADGESATLALEIQDRNARWMAALARARHALADRRSALERLKRVNRPWNR